MTRYDAFFLLGLTLILFIYWLPEIWAVCKAFEARQMARAHAKLERDLEACRHLADLDEDIDRRAHRIIIDLPPLKLTPDRVRRRPSPEDYDVDTILRQIERQS